MDNLALAREVINGLLANKKEGVDLDFVRAVDLCLLQEDWPDALKHCEQAQQLAARSASHEIYLDAVVDLCMGAVYHAWGRIRDAIQWYERSRLEFSLVDEHGEAIAWLALGLGHGSNYENTDAAGYLKSSRDLLRKLQERHRQKTRVCSSYRQLLAYVDSQLDRIQSRSRSDRRLIPRGVAVAGQPLYSLALDLWTDEVEIEGQAFELVHLKTRAREEFRLRAAEQYLVVDVKGSSMTTPDGGGIHNGDRVLVRRQPSVDTSSIALVRLDEYYGSSVLVKRVRWEQDHIVLESANPQFPPREFGAESPALAILGEVIAILHRH